MPTTPSTDREQNDRLIVDISETIKTELSLDKLQTPGGKKIKAEKNRRGQIQITFATGGETPKEFQGVFTDIRATTSAIRSYLDRINNDKKQSNKAKD